jgi:hypothetical protein
MVPTSCRPNSSQDQSCTALTKTLMIFIPNEFSSKSILMAYHMNFHNILRTVHANITRSLNKHHQFTRVFGMYTVETVAGLSVLGRFVFPFPYLKVNAGRLSSNRPRRSPSRLHLLPIRDHIPISFDVTRRLKLKQRH